MSRLDWLPRGGLIGVVHLRALPGSPNYAGSRQAVEQAAMRDAEAWIEGGADALLVENFFDVPFYPERVPHEVVAHMSVLTAALQERCARPCGVNVLRNDGLAALAVAHAAGCRFIRVNVLTGARVTDQGLVQGRAYALLRQRRHLEAQIDILADVDVKHSAPLGASDRRQEIEDTVERGGADAIIVSGSGTGRSVDVASLEQARATTDAPLLVGSGVTADNVATLEQHADGFIVGTACKGGGRIDAPVDAARVRSLRQAIPD